MTGLLANYFELHKTQFVGSLWAKQIIEAVSFVLWIDLKRDSDPQNQENHEFRQCVFKQSKSSPKVLENCVKFSYWQHFT